jgi:hypothetical protein
MMWRKEAPGWSAVAEVLLECVGAVLVTTLLIPVMIVLALYVAGILQ